MEQNRTDLNGALQSMGNPMQNLIGTMKDLVCKMGVREYADVLKELNQAEEHICKAVDLAQRITYGVR